MKTRGGAQQILHVLGQRLLEAGVVSCRHFHHHLAQALVGLHPLLHPSWQLRRTDGCGGDVHLVGLDVGIVVKGAPHVLLLESQSPLVLVFVLQRCVQQTTHNYKQEHHTHPHSLVRYRARNARGRGSHSRWSGGCVGGGREGKRVGRLRKTQGEEKKGAMKLRRGLGGKRNSHPWSWETSACGNGSRKKSLLTVSSSYRFHFPPPKTTTLPFPSSFPSLFSFF